MRGFRLSPPRQRLRERLASSHPVPVPLLVPSFSSPLAKLGQGPGPTRAQARPLPGGLPHRPVVLTHVQSTKSSPGPGQTALASQARPLRTLRGRDLTPISQRWKRSLREVE